MRSVICEDLATFRDSMFVKVNLNMEVVTYKFGVSRTMNSQKGGVVTKWLCCTEQ